jgi:hypothetical protein
VLLCLKAQNCYLPNSTSDPRYPKADEHTSFFATPVAKSERANHANRRNPRPNVTFLELSDHDSFKRGLVKSPTSPMWFETVPDVGKIGRPDKNVAD